MKLFYRGNQYNTETALLEVKESDVTGTYRGNQWSGKLPKHISHINIKPKLGLQYRGVTYNTCYNRNIKPYFQEKAEAIANLEKLIPLQITEQNLGQIHIKNLRQNLERRIKIAQENENYHLLEMLEKECKQLSLSC